MRCQPINEVNYRVYSNSGYLGYVDVGGSVWADEKCIGRVDQRSGKVYKINDIEVGFVSERGVVVCNGDIAGLVNPYLEVWSRGEKVGWLVGSQTNLVIAGGGALLLLLTQSTQTISQLNKSSA